jgi:hypothetical protein
MRPNEDGLSPMVLSFMLFCPGIIAKSLAITATAPRNDSPCYGFGMLAYTFELVGAAIGGRGMLSSPEVEATVLDLRTGEGEE